MSAQSIFTILFTLESLINIIHDWLHIPGITHGRQVRAALGLKLMLLGTLINSIICGPAVYLGIHYWNIPAPLAVKIYWGITSAFIVMGAITSWWIPYFRGTTEKTTKLYAQMYAGTIQLLPPHGDNPRPNLLHLVMHTLFVVTLVTLIFTLI